MQRRAVYTIRYFNSQEAANAMDLKQSHTENRFKIIDDSKTSLKQLNQIIDLESYTPLRFSFQVLRVI